MPETSPNILQGCLSALRTILGGSSPTLSETPSVERVPPLKSPPETPPIKTVTMVTMPDIDVQSQIQESWEAVQTALPSRTIHLRGSITDEMANRLIGHLLLLDRLSTEPILLIIHSQGGQAYAGLAVYNTLRYITAPVITVVDTICAGNALLLLLAGQRRYALAASEIVYTPLTAGVPNGPDGFILGREIQRLQALHTNIFQQHIPGLTFYGWDMGAVREFTPQEAVDYTLIEAVVGRIENIVR